jgi:hypothetical protein
MDVVQNAMQKMQPQRRRDTETAAEKKSVFVFLLCGPLCASASLRLHLLLSTVHSPGIVAGRVLGGHCSGV